MAHVMLIFMAMPFLGVRIGIPMLSGGGNTTPPVPPTIFLQATFATAANEPWGFW